MFIQTKVSGRYSGAGKRNPQWIARSNGIIFQLYRKIVKSRFCVLAVKHNKISTARLAGNIRNHVRYVRRVMSSFTSADGPGRGGGCQFNSRVSGDKMFRSSRTTRFSFKAAAGRKFQAIQFDGADQFRGG